MEDIIADAKALGKKIAAHPRSANFLKAARAVSEDREAQALLKKYQEQVQKLQQLESTGKAIEVADKHALTDCESQLAGNDKIKDMMKYQADYMELMNRINRAIDEATSESGA